MKFICPSCMLQVCDIYEINVFKRIMTPFKVLLQSCTDLVVGEACDNGE